MNNDQEENLRLAYSQLCTTYHRLKNFRANLLALLPITSGAGLIFLLSNPPDASDLTAIGLFGAAFTLGLFVYELHGTVLVARLIETGVKLENELGLETSQFLNRPGGLGGNIGAVAAAIIVYGSVFCAWLYLGA